MKETVDTFQNLYQIRNITEIILPDNHMDRFERLRFNMVKTGFIECCSFCFFSSFIHFDLAMQLSNELNSFVSFDFEICSGIVNTRQRNGNEYTNWHFLFTKVSRICTKLSQSQMFHHFIGICEWTVIASNGYSSFFKYKYCCYLHD